MKNKLDNTIDQDVVDKLSKRFKLLNDLEKSNLQRYLFINDYPLSEFVDSILNIENLQVRFNTFYAAVDVITFERARRQLYFILISEDRSDKRRPEFRTCDPRAVEMFEKLPDSINLSLKLLKEDLKIIALIQLTVNKLETGYKFIGRHLQAISPTPAAIKKRKNENGIMPNPKRHKMEEVAYNTDYVENVWTLYESAGFSLANFDKDFWNKLHDNIFQSKNSFETFFQCLCVITKQDDKNKFLRIFMNPPGEWKIRPGRMRETISIYEPSRDLLQPKSNKKRIMDLLPDTLARPFKSQFKAHLDSENLVAPINNKHVCKPDLEVDKMSYNRNADITMDDQSKETAIHNPDNQLFFGENTLRKHYPLVFRNTLKDRNMPRATERDFASYFSFWESTDKKWEEIDSRLATDEAPLTRPS